MSNHKRISLLSALFLAILSFHERAARSEDLNLPLLESASTGNVTTALKLLEQGANPETVSEKGYSVLAIAGINGNSSIVEALLNYGADPDRKVGQGTALIYTAAQKHSETVFILIMGGADPNGVTPSGKTALHFAAAYDDDEMASLLLKNGAMVNAQSKSGLTPLMMAAKNGHLMTVTKLLLSGADVSLQDTQGKTARDHAQAAGRNEITTLIDIHVSAQNEQPAKVGKVIEVSAGDNLQAAIDKAQNGDVILLSAGEHTGQIRVEKKQLTIRGDRRKRTILKGLNEPQRPVVLVADGGKVVISDIEFKFQAEDQIAVYTYKAQAEIIRCQFHQTPNMSCYVQNGTMIIDGCEFSELSKASVFGTETSFVEIRDSLFRDCRQGAVHVQGNSSVLVENCKFRKINSYAVAGLKQTPVTVTNCEFAQCYLVAVVAQQGPSLIVRDNSFIECKQSVRVLGRMHLIQVMRNVISAVPQDGDGININGIGWALICDNRIQGGDGGIMISLDSVKPPTLARNTIVGVKKLGVFIHRNQLKSEPLARLSRNTIITDEASGVVLSEAKKVVLTNNRILCKRGASVLIHNNSSALLNGNVLVSSHSTLNFLKGTPSQTWLRKELLFGRIVAEEAAPKRFPEMQKLENAVLASDEIKNRLLNDVQRIFQQTTDPSRLDYDKLKQAISSLDQQAALIQKQSDRLTEVKMFIEDSVGRKRATGFSVYDGHVSSFDSPQIRVSDLKNSRRLIEKLQKAKSGPAAYLMKKAGEEVRDTILFADSSEPEVEVLQVIAGELDRLVDGPLLYDKKWFLVLPLSSKTKNDFDQFRATHNISNCRDDLTIKKMKKLKEDQKQRARLLNRNLLETVFPIELSKSGVLASVNGGSTFLLPGRYWLVSNRNPSLAKRVTISSGKAVEIVMNVENSLWLQFQVRSDKPATWDLFVSRPRPEMQQALSRLRRPQENGAELKAVVLKPDLNQETLSQARKLARKAIKKVLVHPVYPENGTIDQTIAITALHDNQEKFVQRILAVAGEMQDAREIHRLLVNSDIDVSDSADWLAVVAQIEKRYAALNYGILDSLLEDKNRELTVQAAIQLHLSGLSDGDDLLRKYMSNPPNVSEIWKVTETAYALLDSGDPETLQAMRSHMKNALMFLEKKGKQAVGYNYITVPMSIYLLAYGDDEDRRLAAQCVQRRGHVFYLGFLAEDPLMPAKYLVQANYYGEARKLWAAFRDRSPAETRFLQETLRYMLVTHAANKQKGFYAERDRLLYADLTQYYTSCFQPSREIVASFSGFETTLVPLDPNKGSRYGTWLKDFNWLPKPEYLDAYILKWFEGNFVYMEQLEYIETEVIKEAVQKHGNGKTPPLYDLFLALHRISTQAGTNRLDTYPMGVDRRSFLMIHKQGNLHGGVNGVAEMALDFQDETLQIRLKLNPKPYYYNGALIALDKEDDYPFHRQVINNGRGLIKNITLRNGEQIVTAKDTGRMQDGYFVFETKIPKTKSHGWYLDVNMEFVKQNHTLTYSLFAGENARHIRRQVDQALSSLGKQ